VSLLVIAWVLWCVVHSALIARPVTDFFRRRLGPRFHFYRLGYNLLAVATLIPVVLHWKSLDTVEVFRWAGILAPLRLTLLAAAGIFFLLGARAYDMRQFLGLEGSGSGGGLSQAGEISAHGILGLSRHPWYLGTGLFIWCFSPVIEMADLATLLLLTIYLLVGTLLEERKLVAEFGDGYRHYIARVPMLVPIPLTGRWRIVRRLLATGLIVCFLVVNVMAWMHAGAMTRYVPAGDRTAPPEDLSSLQKAMTLVSGVTIPRPGGERTPAEHGLAFTTHHFGGSQGHRLEAWHIPTVDPGAPLVILLHGYAAWKASLLPTAARLHELDCTILLVDCYGSGGSSGHDTTIGYRESEDAAAALGYARQQWPEHPVILYGLSMGGAAALRAVAAEGAAPDGLVVESCFDTLLNTVRARFRAMGLPPTPLAELLIFWGGVRGGFNAFAHNPVDYANRISCPALVLHGSNNRRVALVEARRLHDALTGPRRFSAYPRAGHQPLAETDPQQWKSDLAWLLAEIAGEHR